MSTIKQCLAVAVLLWTATGCDKAKEWIDLGGAKKSLPKKRDSANSIKSLQTGKWHFEPQPAQLGFGKNWVQVAVSSTPSIKPSLDAAGESQPPATASSSSSQSSSQNNQTDGQPEKSILPSFVCGLSSDNKLFCGNLQSNVAAVHMVEVQGGPQNPSPGELQVSAGHVCVKTLDRLLFCGQLQQSDHKPVVMRKVQQGGLDKTGVEDWELSDTHLCATAQRPPVPAFVGDRSLACGALPTRFDQSVRLYQGQVLQATPERWVQPGWNNWFALSGDVVCSTLRKTDDIAPVEGQRLFCGKLSTGGGATQLVEEKTKRVGWSDRLYQVDSHHICGLFNGNLACGRFPDKVDGEFETKSVSTAQDALAGGGIDDANHFSMSGEQVCVWANNLLFCGDLPASQGEAVSLTRQGPTTAAADRAFVYASKEHVFWIPRHNSYLGNWGAWHRASSSAEGSALTLKKVSAIGGFTFSDKTVAVAGVYGYFLRGTQTALEGGDMVSPYQLLALDIVSGKSLAQVGSSQHWQEGSLTGNHDYACGIQTASGSGAGMLWCWLHETYESPQESQ